MYRVFRLIGRLLAALLLLVVLAAGAIAGLLWYTLPGGDRSDAIPGLSAPGRITIDADGVPRIRAASDTDAATALGYLHARDRLFQMDLMRRAARGELSEIVGPATLMLDKTARVLGLQQRAKADLAALDPETRAVLDAYARGVNAWIAARGRFAAAEFLLLGAPRPWTATDSLLWGKTMGMYLSGNWRVELARAGLPLDADLDRFWPPIHDVDRPEAALAPLPEPVRRTAVRLDRLLPSFPSPFTLPATASNEWAVDGMHSASGAPLLAGDPHLALGMPGIWYLARIDTPSGVLAGATAPGVPFLVLGHNGHIAWSFTSTGADTQDVFVETPAGDGGYMTPEGPRRFETRMERIHVRGAADVVLTVRETRHGPVISDILGSGGPILAVSMANLAPGDTAAAGLRALNQADDVDAAGRAAALISSPVQNLLVADRRRIAMFMTGRVPIRRAGDGARPVDGADGAHDWIGWASGSELPYVVAPSSGRLVNANERVAPADFPVFLGRDWYGDYRAQRIRALLGTSEAHTAASFAAMQVDSVSNFARRILPILLATPPSTADGRAAVTSLARWDGTMAIDLAQPLIFNAWMRHFAAALRARLAAPASATAPDTDLIAAALYRAPMIHAIGTRCGGDCTPLLTDSLRSALVELHQRFGPDMTTWRWGAAHPAVFAHPLLRAIPVLGDLLTARIAAPGDDTTLFRGGMAGNSFDSVHGAAYRGVYDLADLDHSLFVVAPGQSGHVLSGLARNFVQRWRDGGTITLTARPTQVETRITLLPQG